MELFQELFRFMVQIYGIIPIYGNIPMLKLEIFLLCVYLPYGTRDIYRSTAL